MSSENCNFIEPMSIILFFYLFFMRKELFHRFNPTLLINKETDFTSIKLHKKRLLKLNLLPVFNALIKKCYLQEKTSHDT